MLYEKGIRNTKSNNLKNWHLMSDCVSGIIYNAYYVESADEIATNSCLRSYLLWLETKDQIELEAREKYEENIESFFSKLVKSLENQNKEEVLKNTRYLNDELSKINRN